MKEEIGEDRYWS